MVNKCFHETDDSILNDDRNYWIASLTILIIGTFVTGILLIYTVYEVNKRQELAFQGDEIAARRLILPCYKPLLIILSILFIVVAIATCGAYDNSFGYSYNAFKLLQFHGLCLTGVYSIGPSILLQKSVSINSFKQCALLIIPWWILCFSLWCGSLVASSCKQSKTIEIIFSLIVFIPILLLCIAVYTRTVYTRIHLTSRMHRGAYDFFLVFSLFYFISNMVLYHLIGINKSLDKESIGILCFSILSTLWSLFFPYAMFLCLYADTKYWRGIGKRNVGGIHNKNNKRNSISSGQQPSITVSVVSTDFQDMMSDVSDTILDYAFIRVEEYIAKGATAEVYRAIWKNKIQLAMKVYTPSEITKEVIEELVLEGKVAIQLKHPNIVRYYGVCIRPPQISMVMEYCSKGDLKSSLQKHPENWSKAARIKACLEAARAIKYLHKLDFIHRDIKASNFFVTDDNIVKLGDFGESTKKRSIESTASKRMTLLGTVPFMAPEIINATRHYTEAIDIYALGITFWEIWTGDDPYGDTSTFDIYNYVKDGKRPKITNDMPNDFVDILISTWLAESNDRPSARILVVQMKKCFISYIQNNNIDPSLFSNELETVNRITEVGNPTMTRRLSNFVKRMSMIATPSNVIEASDNNDIIENDDDDDDNETNENISESLNQSVGYDNNSNNSTPDYNLPSSPMTRRLSNFVKRMSVIGMPSSSSSKNFLETSESNNVDENDEEGADVIETKSVSFGGPTIINSGSSSSSSTPVDDDISSPLHNV